MNNKHPLKNISLIFYPDTHSYIDDLNNKYISVSEWVENFFEKFDTDKIASKCAIQREVTKESLLQEWKKLGDNAAYKGNIVHEMLKCKFTGIKFQIDEQNKNIYHMYKKHVDIIFKEINNKLESIYIEHVIFDPDKKIAGTCDGLFITKDKSKYILIDWKTCKNIDKTNTYNKWGKYPYHLPDCNYYHYCLQLSMYNHILKTQGYLKYDIPMIQKIVHICENKINTIDSKLINIE